MALPTEVLQYTKELETHMQQFAENLKNNNFDKLKENEDGFRDAMNNMLKFYYINYPNDKSVNDLKNASPNSYSIVYCKNNTREKWYLCWNRTTTKRFRNPIIRAIAI